MSSRSSRRSTCGSSFRCTGPDGNGALQDINPDEAAPAWQRGAKARKGKAKQAKQSKKEAFDTAYNALCLGGDAPTVRDLVEYYSQQEDGDARAPSDQDSVSLDSGIRLRT